MALYAAPRARSPHLDLPIALALAVGGIAGVISTFTNYGDTYFDSLTVLVFLLLVGRFLQHRRQGVANDALELLFSLTPMSAHQVTPEGIMDVPISALKVGDIVEIRRGRIYSGRWSDRPGPLRRRPISTDRRGRSPASRPRR